MHVDKILGIRGTARDTTLQEKNKQTKERRGQNGEEHRGNGGKREEKEKRREGGAGGGRAQQKDGHAQFQGVKNTSTKYMNV